MSAKVGGMKRLSVNVDDETIAALKSLAETRGTSVTEIVRRAVAVYKFVQDETVTNGKSLQVVDKERGEVTDVVVLG